MTGEVNQAKNFGNESVEYVASSWVEMVMMLESRE